MQLWCIPNTTKKLRKSLKTTAKFLIYANVNDRTQKHKSTFDKPTNDTTVTPPKS